MFVTCEAQTTIISGGMLILPHAPKCNWPYMEDGYPYAFPMNYIYLDGKIYFHWYKAWHKLDALATSDNKASFCVMDEGFRKSGGGL